MTTVGHCGWLQKVHTVEDLLIFFYLPQVWSLELTLWIACRYGECHTFAPPVAVDASLISSPAGSYMSTAAVPQSTGVTYSLLLNLIFGHLQGVLTPTRLHAKWWLTSFWTCLLKELHHTPGLITETQVLLSAEDRSPVHKAALPDSPTEWPSPNMSYNSSCWLIFDWVLFSSDNLLCQDKNKLTPSDTTVRSAWSGCGLHSP